MAMSTLSQRLQKVQQPSPDPEYDFSHMSMDQLEVSKIQFGKAHVGKTFNHMWTREQKWIMWFTQHYHSSNKWEHRVFLYYVEKKIERCELTGVKMPTRSAVDQATEKANGPPAQLQGAQPKAKAMPVQATGALTDPWDLDEDHELFDVLQEGELMPTIEPLIPDQTVNHLENRMAHVENALNKIINYIEQNTTTLISEQ
jgi:hypothetical protein